MIAKITFEDKGECIVVGIEDVMAGNPTLAQQAAMTLFAKVKEEVRDEVEILSEKKITLRAIK